MATDNNDTIHLPLEGMNSEHCALIIDKGLSKVQGIRTHTVELSNNRAVINTDDTVAVLKKAVAAIRYLGYDVSTVKKNFPVVNYDLCILCNKFRKHFKQSARSS